ncbi:MAG: hypothetical protein J6W04_00175 [Bacteroidales bacterium]|nr:hypothetical protein [Bacteroidales bacterium]
MKKWLEKATNDEILERLKWAAVLMTSSVMREDGITEFELCIAELKKRLNG